jgi:predicted DCC family thiol-disulfide oxidoreductase YuxK
MPGKALVIFDGQCGFCRIWIEYWKQLTGDRLEYAPSQEVGAQYPQIPPEKFNQSVQLAMPDGEIMAGARAVFVTLTFAPGFAWLLWTYYHLPGFAPLSEAAYRFVASHRNFFYQATRFTFGRRISPLRYATVEWLFLRALAAIYFIAFASLAVQIAGFAGARGILPAGQYFEAVHQTFGARGYWLAPSIFWLAHGDTILRAACAAGAVVSIALLFGYRERICLACLYALYLSLCTAGQDFMSFQWDMLLLETGFLAIFLGSSKWVALLFRWLLFRLMFLSGAVKLLSHDLSWHNLTAMSFHYMTQPLPTPIAWYMHQLPPGLQRFSTGAVLFIELFIPFLIFGPRPWRLMGAFFLLGLQALIALTGNYAFFNLLAMALCLFLFDDARLARFRLRGRRSQTKPIAAACITAVVLVLSFSELSGVFLDWTPAPGRALERWATPFGIVNTYGLFAVMTIRRPEIAIQGSNDGVTWRDYSFRYKPGDLGRAPRWVAPYQPRLDWQMWFAALSGREGTPWFGNLLVRLLQGSPEVDGLLAGNPFPAEPPKYVRAQLFDYSFTDFRERKETGTWWKRRPLGLYFPAISLENVR